MQLGDAASDVVCEPVSRNGVDEARIDETFKLMGQRRDAGT